MNRRSPRPCAPNAERGAEAHARSDTQSDTQSDTRNEPNAFDASTNLEFSKFYENWHLKVRRWVLSMGAPVGDADDVTQEIFIIVRRKLPSYYSGNTAGWLFRITERTVRDFRRKAWYRRALPRGSAEEVEGVPSPPSEEPGAAYERTEALQMLGGVLSRMTAKRRETFVLFVLEGFSGEEIATLQRVPLSTVWTRLYHARRDLSRLIQAPEK